jgi:hypothetical protein
MPELKRSQTNRQEDTKRKSRKKDQESRSSSDKPLMGDAGLDPIAETPFLPKSHEHAAILTGIPFSVQRHEFIMRLHRTYGSSYVHRLIKSVNAQAKLTVSDPGDIYEQEADRVAEQVTRSINNTLQRQTPDEEEELLQGKALIQRQIPEEEEIQAQEEEEIQPQMTANEKPIISNDIETRINNTRGEQPPAHELTHVVQQAVDRFTSETLMKNGDKMKKGWDDAVAERVRAALEKLPRGAVEDNDALEKIVPVSGVGASSYNLRTKKFEIVYPKGAGWIFVRLGLGPRKLGTELLNWIRIREIGLPENPSQEEIEAYVESKWNKTKKGKLKAWQESYGMAEGVPLSVLPTGTRPENMVDWLVRHEIGHSYDNKIKWTKEQSNQEKFGGWEILDGEEVLARFMTDEGYEPEGGEIRRYYSDAFPEYTPDFAKMDSCLATHKTGLGEDDKAAAERAIKRLKGASLSPWLRDDGGGDIVRVDDKLYHWYDLDQNWYGYLANARGNRVSNYQFSNAADWFAEAFAAYFHPDGPDNRLTNEVLEWFATEFPQKQESEEEGEEA